MPNLAKVAVLSLLVSAGVFGAFAAEKSKPAAAKPQVDASGTVRVPPFSLPYSNLASPEAKAAFIEHSKHPFSGPDLKNIAAFRKSFDDGFVLPLVAKLSARY